MILSEHGQNPEHHPDQENDSTASLLTTPSGCSLRDYHGFSLPRGCPFLAKIHRCQSQNYPHAPAALLPSALVAGGGAVDGMSPRTHPPPALDPAALLASFLCPLASGWVQLVRVTGRSEGRRQSPGNWSPPTPMGTPDCLHPLLEAPRGAALSLRSPGSQDQLRPLLLQVDPHGWVPVLARMTPSKPHPRLCKSPLHQLFSCRPLLPLLPAQLNLMRGFGRSSPGPP